MGRVMNPAASELRLSPRERQVLALLGQGLQLKDIAVELRVSTKWVKNVRFMLGRKFGAHTSLQIVLQAMARGMVPCPAAASARRTSGKEEACGISGSR